MLQILRAYQRYIFLVITVVIIISFSFFGTNSNGPDMKEMNPTAFTAIDGSDVTRSELEAMVNFIATDARDKMMLGGRSGLNFFNDGVIRGDILETGIARVIAEEYFSELEGDFQSRIEKERYYKPYTNPQAPFLGAETTWRRFAPKLSEAYVSLKTLSNVNNIENFNARVELYSQEQNFPQHILKQAIRYQESQFEWITPDANLHQYDLSLFGYHSLDDWFGHKFVSLSAQFIINSAKLAKQRGYDVSKEEVLYELAQNATRSYAENKENPIFAGMSQEAYVKQQLQDMGMDQARAVKVWKQVLLFRRLFEDMGSSAFVDRESFQSMAEFAKTNVTAETYYLADALQFSDANSLQEFQLYLSAVTSPEEAKTLHPLALPNKFKTVEQVKATLAELVQRRYVIDATLVDLESLQTQVAIKDMWAWETNEANWSVLAKKFPELGAADAKTTDDRFNALERLNDKIREKVDSYAKESIVNANPEWLENALRNAEAQRYPFSISMAGTDLPLLGYKGKRAELIQTLNEAKIADPESDDPSQWFKLSGDQRYVYRMRVLERSNSDELMTFAQAQEAGVLKALVDKTLEAYYMSMRDKESLTFKREDGRYKLFADVRTQVAEFYFAPVLKAIYDDAILAEGKEGAPEKPNFDYCSVRRFSRYARDVRKLLIAKPEMEAQLVRPAKEQDETDVLLIAQEDLKEQWKLQRNKETVERSQVASNSSIAKAFDMDVDTWSETKAMNNSRPLFFKVEEKAIGDVGAWIDQAVNVAYRQLAYEKERALAEEILTQHKLKLSVE
jgi:GcvH upstream region-like protein